MKIITCACTFIILSHFVLLGIKNVSDRSIEKNKTINSDCNILIYISNKMQCYTVYCIWKLLYIFLVVPPPIIRNANNCVYSIWYLSHCYCYLPLSWKSWNRFECAVGGVRHPHHTHTSSNSSTIAADSSNGVTNNRCCKHSCLRS
jgi:hypothetical protein